MSQGTGRPKKPYCGRCKREKKGRNARLVTVHKTAPDGSVRVYEWLRCRHCDSATNRRYYDRKTAQVGSQG